MRRAWQYARGRPCGFTDQRPRVLTQSVFQFSYSLLRLAGKIALFAYFLLGLLFLGVRYWVLPHIDEWRPQIERQLSSTLDTHVSLGPLSAEWKGLNPKLQALDVRFTDEQGRSLLAVPQARATFSWRSLFSGSLQFVTLEASDVDLTLRRDREDQFWILGRSFSMDSASSSPGQAGRVADWLLEQRYIVLSSATLRWIDEERNAPPLILERVTVNLANRHADHRFMLRAETPASLGRSLDLRGEFQHLPTGESGRLSLNEGRGQLYAHVEDMRPLGWAPWIDMPQDLKSGKVSARSWLKFDAGAIRSLTSDVTVGNGYWESAHHQARAASLRLFMSGPWQDFTRLLAQYGADPALAAAPQDSGVEYRLLANHLEIQAPGVFEHPLALEHLISRGMLRHDDKGWDVESPQLDLANRDVAASLQGQWRQGAAESLGSVDIRGNIARAAIPAIKRYLPNSVHQDARTWMEHGLVAGQITGASLVLRGDLEHFPFDDAAEQGDFSVEGRYADAIIDYLPAEKGSLGWPRLTDMRGSVSLQRSDLSLSAEHALMWPTPKQPIQLSNLQARIPTLDRDPVLTITGDTAAPAETYLTLMTHAPLGQMLDGQFNQSRADGNWEVPLSLTIPLMHSRDTTVKGAIRFSGGNVRLTPEMPAFSRVTGALDFTDTAFSAADLKGEFLGGPVAIDGGVGAALKGLRFQGTASADALADYVGLDGMRRFDGQMAYLARLHRGQGKDRAFLLDIESDLKGMAMDFPAPLGKTAKQALPLRLAWRPHTDGKSMALDIALGDQLRASLLHRENQKGGAYFHAGALGVSQNAVAPDSGMALDVRYPTVDVDAWNAVVKEFANTLPGAGQASNRPVLPAISRLRLQADEVRVQGLLLDTVTFTAHQPTPQQWRVDVSSTQTAGTLFWREADGRIAGHIDAKFDRLSLGGEQAADAPKDESDYEFDDDLDIPGVNLEVRKFRLYGRDAGALSLVGVNQSRGHLWRLEHLTLKSASAELSGSGMWRLSGPDRGLTLDAEARIADMGEYLDQIGQKDVMKAGEGTLQSRLEWRNMPWSFSKTDLNGEITFSLRKGRFSALNSYSARLLELLSLQSVRRLARLDFNPAGLTKEGFPYDDLRGTVKVADGLMRTSDYRVIGPVGTIVIGGDVNLVNQRLDLQAVVIPNLDVSGAAVAAGIAINPIVGVGAFLTQWFLRTPLAKAMTVQYQIGGEWDDPQINEVSGPAPSAPPASGREPEAVIEH